MAKKFIITCFAFIMFACFSGAVAAESFVTWPDNTIEVDYPPTNIIVADDGTSYVTNNSGGIMKYLPNGTLDVDWGESGKAVGEIRPIFLSFDGNGDILTGSADDALGVYKIDSQTGDSEVILENVLVAGIAVDADNSMYLNTGNSLLKYQDMELVWETSIVSGYEMGLCLMPDQSIITTNEGDGTVQKYTSDGSVDLSFGTSGVLHVSASNIGFASYDDQLYVSCYGEGVIKKISLDGQNIEPVLTGASPTVLVAKNNYYFITNWLNNSIDCFEKPNINVEDDQFTYAVSPMALNPGENTVVTIDIFSNSTEAYDITAKVYNKSDNQLVSDITATTATLADGDASIELIPPPDGWPAGLFYIEIVFSDNVESITVSDSLRIDADVLIAENLAYTISFDSNGGTPVDAISQDYGTPVHAPADPAREGHTFAGWDLDIPETMPIDGAHLTAQWTVNRYTVSFDSNGGTPVDSISQDYGTRVNAPPDPTKEGYIFAGWNPGLPETMPVGGAVLTAQWRKTYYQGVAVEVSNVEGLDGAVDFSQDLASGKDVTVLLDIRILDEADVPEPDKKMIEDQLSADFAESNKNILFVDISLFKITYENDVENRESFSTSNSLIKITIKIPEEHRTGMAYQVIRVHDGKASYLETIYDQENHTLTFETDRFSTYAIAYSASEQEDETETADPIPATGESSHLNALHLLLATLFGFMLITRIIMKRRMNKREQA